MVSNLRLQSKKEATGIVGADLYGGVQRGPQRLVQGGFPSLKHGGWGEEEKEDEKEEEEKLYQTGVWKARKNVSADLYGGVQRGPQRLV